MGSAKGRCNRCGVSILNSTKNKTGGYCIPCKRSIDLDADIQKRREHSKTKQMLARKKYGKHVGFVIALVSLAIMILASAFQIYEHFPRSQTSEPTSFISLLIVIVASIGMVFFVAVAIYSIWHYLKALHSNIDQ